MKIFAALKTADFAAKLSAAAGFDLEAALAKGDANALKAYIDSAVAAATEKATKLAAEADAQIKTFAVGLEEATAENTKLIGENNVLVATFSLAGITLPTHAETISTTERIAANKAVLDAHIKKHACALLAQSGHLPVAVSPGTGDVPTLTGRDLLEARIGESLIKIKAARR